MKYIYSLLLVLALTSCESHYDGRETAHYEQWRDGAGWHPDYHDEEHK